MKNVYTFISQMILRYVLSPIYLEHFSRWLIRWGGGGGVSRNVCHTLSPFFSILYSFEEKNAKNNRLAPPPPGLTSPIRNLGSATVSDAIFRVLKHSGKYNKTNKTMIKYYRHC